MYKKFSLIFVSLFIPVILLMFVTEYSYADTFRYVSYNKNITVKKLDSGYIIKMGRRLKGTKKITVKSSNSKIIWTNSEAANYLKKPFFTPMKNGKAVLTIKLKKSGKTETYRVNIKVAAPKIYKIKYNLDGGKNNSKNRKTFTAKTKTFKLKAAKKKGYDFGGWYKDKKLKKKIVKVKKGTKKNITVYAKWIKRTYVKDFSKVTYDKSNMIFNALQKGKFSAEKVSDVWYYKFTRGKNAILVPVSVFKDKKTSNVPSWFNDSVTSKLNYDSSTYGKSFLTKAFEESSYTGAKGGPIQYRHSIYITKGLIKKEEGSIDLQCSDVRKVTFAVCDKDPTSKKKPETASDYRALIQRYDSNKDTPKIIPQMTVTMNNPEYYNGDLFFNTYTVTGRGTKLTSDLHDVIEVAVSTGKMLSSFSVISFKTLLDLYGWTDNLVKESDLYVGNGKIEQLSDYDQDDEDNSKYCYAYRFKSPLAMKEAKDFILFHVDTSEKWSFEGTNMTAEFKLEFPKSHDNTK